jgi:hypothetical protein
MAATCAVSLCGAVWAGIGTSAAIDPPATTQKCCLVGPGCQMPALNTVDVQIALLLDTSNSMDGLINQARTQLWTIVKEMSSAKRDGRPVRLQVALYEYGNDGLQQKDGFIRQVTGFTTDLDSLSEKLWSLQTNGGSEFCGHVIQQAVGGLAWDSDPKTYKAIFIAGNEPFTQGEVDYTKSIATAMGRGVVVNTIHCGDANSGMSGMWADAAKRGEGQYSYINQDRVTVAVETPQDKVLIELNVKLNATYLPYGKDGDAGRERQMAADSTAASAAPQAAAERVAVKATGNYQNSNWDLVDALRDGRVKLEEVDAKDLPAEYAKLSKEELAAKVKELQDARAELQKQIARASAERDEFLRQSQPTTQPGEETLDSAAKKIAREQMRERGFEVE